MANTLYRHVGLLYLYSVYIDIMILDYYALL